MAENRGDSASQLVDRLANDAQFRASLEGASTLHDKAEVVKAAGYGDVNLDAIQAAAKDKLAALGAGVQVAPERVKRVEELYLRPLPTKRCSRRCRPRPPRKHSVPC